MNKILLIASGGLDSTVLYYYLKSKYQQVDICNFSYGSKHNKIERERLKKNIDTKIYYIDIDLSFLNSSLLKGGIDIPEGHYAQENMKSTVVPFRNGIMLSYAIAIADNYKYDAVALGNHTGDHFIYPDCRTEFINGISQAAEQGTFNKIKIISPFNDISKTGITKIGKELGIEKIMFNTWTCYKGKKKHCGVCGACNERKEAFKENNIKDLTEYKI